MIDAGWKEEALSQPANWRQTFEPVFVLRKPTTRSCTASTVESNTEDGCEKENNINLPSNEEL